MAEHDPDAPVRASGEPQSYLAEMEAEYQRGPIRGKSYLEWPIFLAMRRALLASASPSDDGAAREPGLDLEPIQARVHRHYGGSELWAECSELLDIKAMLAEIERQRARIVVLETSVDSLRYLIDHPVWQSIESAPKNGSWFLGWNSDCGCFIWRDGPGLLTGEDPAPTHWMPLPSSPAGR